MAEGQVQQGGSGAASGGQDAALPLSFGHALPFFTPLAVFPLLINAAVLGGWWIAMPLAFAVFANQLDRLFGVEQRSAKLESTRHSTLIWYKLPLWLWAALWPPTLIFSLWQTLMVGHLPLWEVLLMAIALAATAQNIFVVGHELIHQRATWERRLGEVLLASTSYPHYATEHVYIHHPLAGTASDAGSAHKGQGFWSYFAAELKANLTGAWRLERARLARRRQPVWHRSNPFWRYLAAMGFWYMLAYWMAGAWAVLAYAILSLGVILSMKLVNYVQHYGLRRVRLPGGRYERMRTHHAWSASHRLSNWRLFNAPRPRGPPRQRQAALSPAAVHRRGAIAATAGNLCSDGLGWPCDRRRGSGKWTRWSINAGLVSNRRLTIGAPTTAQRWPHGRKRSRRSRSCCTPRRGWPSGWIDRRNCSTP